MEQGLPDNWRRVFAGFVALVALWVVVYWAWPAGDPAITFDAGRPHGAGVLPTAGPSAAPGGQRPAADPPPEAPILPRAGAGATPSRPETAPRAQPPRPDRPGVIPPRFAEYTVRKNDTLRSIARARLGSEKYADAISRANPLTDTERLKPGAVLKIPLDPGNIQGTPVGVPPPEVARKADASDASTTEYVVQKGETLSRIAKKVYNDATLADTIFQANRDRLRSRDSVREGQRLKIPPRPAARAGS